MGLLGRGAMVLGFDIEAGAVEEHDDWHTHEHFAERLGIPGFLRASRWTAEAGGPRYFVLYEVTEVGVLTSPAYLDRLNHPSPWTSKMMPHYRGMMRGLCRVGASFGSGVGGAAWVARFAPAPGREEALRNWLVAEALPVLPTRPGLVGAHLLESAAAPPMTNEQKIRGLDAVVAWVLFVTGYDTAAVAALGAGEFGSDNLMRRGAASGASGCAYRLALARAASDDQVC